MMISLTGVLIRAAETCERSRDNKHLGYMLRQLRDHINMLREQPEKLQIFLDLYVEDSQQKAG